MAKPGRTGGDSGDGLVSFDVEILAGDRWLAESMFDSRLAAEAAALKLFESKRKPRSVRVVREIFDPVTGEVTTVMVFLRSRGVADAKERAQADAAADSRLEESRRRRALVRAAARQAALGRGRQTPARRQTYGIWMASLVVGVVAGALYAFYRLGLLSAL